MLSSFRNPSQCPTGQGEKALPQNKGKRHSGLKDLELEWLEIVIEIITKPPIAAAV